MSGFFLFNKQIMLSLYFHIPFCNHKCFYCDFYSLGKFNKNQEDAFTESLLIEIDLSAKKYYKNQKIETIFFGGGTPSVLSVYNFNKIADKIKQSFDLSNLIEWTMEANPESITKERLENYLQNGVNRLSIGAQSFNNDELIFLERIHNSDEIKEKYYLSRESGFENISLDLIFSLPKQSRENWLNSLNSVFELDPEHISAYSLIFEEKTKLYNQFQKGLILPNDPDFEHDLYIETIELMEKNGLYQYEISNYSKIGKECKHNLNYWYGTDYLSFGPSAHSFIENKRFWNYRSLKKYNELLSQKIIPEENFEIINTEMSLTEAIYLQLRSKGIFLEEFKAKFDIDLLNLVNMKLEYLFHKHLNVENNILRFTPEGYSISDEITLKIMEVIE